MNTPKKGSPSFGETPSGRLKSNDLRDIVKGLFYSRPPTYLREAIAALENYPEIPIIGTDFSIIESHAIAILCSMRDGTIHYKPINLDDPISGREATMAIIDDITRVEPSDGRDIYERMFDLLYNLPAQTEYKLVKDSSEPIPEPRIVDKPIKQNGKDASYLDFDPTKKHRRGRR
jgi:hypothetical protein